MIYFIYFFFSLTSYSPRLLGRKISFVSFHERPPDNHTQFQTKMFKIYTRFFRPKRLKNHTLWGGTYLYTFYR